MKEWLQIAPELNDIVQLAYSDPEGVCPPVEFVFRGLETVLPEQVRVVILGQDPYYTADKANGLAFGYNRAYKGPIDSSMANILKELGSPDTFDYTLEHWAAQGVLMLNTRLTTTTGHPMGHANIGWDVPIGKIIRYLSERQVFWLIWGTEAYKTAHFNQVPSHRMLYTSHPSSMSASRGNRPFTGSDCFNRINLLLDRPIQWR